MLVPELALQQQVICPNLQEPSSLICQFLSQPGQLASEQAGQPPGADPNRKPDRATFGQDLPGSGPPQDPGPVIQPSGSEPPTLGFQLTTPVTQIH